MDFVDWVLLGDRRVRLDEVREHPERWVRLMAAARAERSARCLCQGDPLRLVTRCSAAGRHSLAVWPLEGPRYDPRCAFHHVDPGLSGRGGYAASAIREVDGQVQVRFASPLMSDTDAAETNPQVPESGIDSSGTRRTTVGLTGLMHFHCPTELSKLPVQVA